MLGLSDEIVREHRDLDYLDIAGVEGDQRERIRGLAPGAVYEVEIGWYVAWKA